MNINEAEHTDELLLPSSLVCSVKAALRELLPKRSLPAKSTNRILFSIRLLARESLQSSGIRRSRQLDNREWMEPWDGVGVLGENDFEYSVGSTTLVVQTSGGNRLEPTTTRRPKGRRDGD